MNKKEFKKLADKHLIIDHRQNTPFGELHRFIRGVDELYEAIDNKIKSTSLRECYVNDELLKLALDNPNDSDLGALIRSKVI